MASKLCCTIEQDARSDSPELPNARISQNAQTYAQPDLIQTDSQVSYSTNDQSQDVLEFRNVFKSVQQTPHDQRSPTPARKLRLNRPSVYSLSRLRKTSSRPSSILRRESKVLAKIDSIELTTTTKAPYMDIDTVLRYRKDEESQKRLLRYPYRDYKSTDCYDPGTEMLDDVIQKLGMRTPIKRPSIHGIEWSPSTGRLTCAITTGIRGATEAESHEVPATHHEDYQNSSSAQLPYIPSAPNLRSIFRTTMSRESRRSHSATSITLPKLAPVSPIRLPSLRIYDQNGIGRSEAISESLRLSHESTSPDNTWTDSLAPAIVKSYYSSLDDYECLVVNNVKDESSPQAWSEAPIETNSVTFDSQQHLKSLLLKETCSAQNTSDMNSIVSREVEVKTKKEHTSEQKSRSSIHLRDMRISHHLRSGSLVSSDQLVETPDLLANPSKTKQCTVEDLVSASLSWEFAEQCELNDSGKDIAHFVAHEDNAFPDTTSDKRLNTSPPSAKEPQTFFRYTEDSILHSSQDIKEINFCDALQDMDMTDSSPTLDEGRLIVSTNQKQESLYQGQRHTSSNEEISKTMMAPLPRNNSVAYTKVSKFREELRPKFKNKSHSTKLIMKLLHHKRVSHKSQSEANMRQNYIASRVDGNLDPPSTISSRERRQSSSLISLQIEQGAMGRGRGVDQVWDHALKVHQAEKASLFLSKNKEIAINASPFRERSASIAIAKIPADSQREEETKFTEQQPSAIFLRDSQQERSPPRVIRRSAIPGCDLNDTFTEFADAFAKQDDHTDVVGAWGRYPSYTRSNRTSSAGKTDDVETRDFALEAAIRFASNGNITHDDDLVDPAERKPSSSPLPGEKMRKKKTGNGRMIKSSSMNFGRTLLRNYAKMFRSQSTEFQRHGHGHRSSITSGGVLEHPELELLPDVWAAGFMATAYNARHESNAEFVVSPPRSLDNRAINRKNTHTVVLDVSPPLTDMETLSHFQICDAEANRPDIQNLGGTKNAHSESYEKPRRGSDTKYEHPINPGSLRKMRPDSERATIRSSSSFAAVPNHPRVNGQLSRSSRRSTSDSQLNCTSAYTGKSFWGDHQSVTSVRHSTLDLVTKFKEQEKEEHQRVMTIGLRGEAS